MRIFAVTTAVVLYVVVTWVAFIIMLLIAGRHALTIPSFPWWATSFWWIGLVAVAWYVGFRLPRRRESDTSGTAYRNSRRTKES